jgi:CRP-like cAMP-binding protein
MGSMVLPVSSDATGPLTKKLCESVPLGANELSLLQDLQSGRIFIRRGEEIIVGGSADQTLFIVIEGVAICYRVLRNRRRHVLNILLSGDIAGVPGCFFETALYSVRTITDSWVSPVPLVRLTNLFYTHPQLAAKMFWCFSCEAAIYAEHLISVAKRTAFERIVHFLLELLARLQAVLPADESSFCLPLTQKLIADALGLSISSVNRVLRTLRDDDLLRIRDKLIIITNVEELSARVDFRRNYLKPLSIADFFERTVATTTPSARNRDFP